MTDALTVTSDRITRYSLNADIWTPLIGLTLAQAADELEFALRARGADKVIDAAGMVSYTLNNQTVTTSMDDLEQALAWIRGMRNVGGGPAFLPLRLA